MAEKSHIEKSFQYAIILLLIVSISLVSTFLDVNTKIKYGEILIGLPIFIAGIVGIFSFIEWIKGRKEKTSLKKIFALIVSLSIAILLLFMFVTNMIEAINVFSKI